MSVLKIDNCYSRLLTDEQKVKDVLWAAMRFRERNYFHNARYKANLWDGYCDFFKRDTGRFLTGLLPEVKLALKQIGLEYKIEDNRSQIQFSRDKIDQNFLNEFLQPGMKPVTLHDYQVDYVNQSIRHKRGVVFSPTACHAPGQEILTYDGSSKKVEDVVVGDLIMGHDREKRTVILLHSGKSQMYKVIPYEGDPFTITGDHLLTLESACRDVVDVRVIDWFFWSKTKKQVYRLIRQNKCGNNYSHVGFEIEPVGEGDYYGFTLKEDPHYLMGDYTVTHNSGKTFIMVGTLLLLPQNLPTLVLANRKSLVDQNYDEIRAWGMKDVGRFYGDHKEIKSITCATVQSAHLMKDHFPKVKCIIVDEIHEMMSKKPRAVYNACKNASVRIGVSATPFKFGEKDKVQKYEVKGYFGPVFMANNTETGRLSTKDLQERKILASAECTFFPVHEPKLPYHVYIDAVTDGIAHNLILHEMTRRLVKSLEGRILIVVERISHGDLLHDVIPGSLWVRGQDTVETRKDIIRQLSVNKKKTVAIATSGIFNTGINVKVGTLINCAGGQAEHQIIQRFGRGLRVAEDKKHLQYFDWYFTNNDYLLKHSEKRIKILESEGHSVIVKDFDL